MARFRDIIDKFADWDFAFQIVAILVLLGIGFVGYLLGK